MPSWQYVKRVLLVLVLLGLALSAMHLTAPDRVGKPSLLMLWARDVVAPVQHSMWQAARVVSAGAAFVFSFGRDTGYTRSLEKKVAELQGEVKRLQVVEQENRRLKAFLDYKETHGGASLVAVVVGRNPDNWFGTITINRGRADGVTRGAVAVTPAGLVGRVLTVSNHTAEVLLITDPRSAVGSAVYETQVPGIVRGTLGGIERLKMQYVVKDEPVRKGFLVRTSSLSGVFPPGIPVGTVTRVAEEESGLFKTVYLRPAVDLNRLEEVLILLKQ
ncbi:MAG: rod shape-determining protein MreC [Bacillota bacterium]